MPAKIKPQPVSKRPGPRGNISDQPKLEPNLARHARKCAICNHPYREHIEDDFISWRSENTIALEYKISSRSAIFRHAAATGLLQRRRRNLRGVAERVLENVDQAPPSASAVLRALRIFTQITEDGQWVEPAKRSIVTHIHVTKHDSLNAPVCHPAGAPSGAHSDVFVGAPSAEGGIMPTGPQIAPLSGCHSEPSALPLRDGGEEPAVYADRVSASSFPSSDDTFVGADRLHRPAAVENVDTRSVEAVGAASLRPHSVSVSAESSTATSPTRPTRTSEPRTDRDYYTRLASTLHRGRGIVPERPGATALKKEPASVETPPNANAENTLPRAAASEILIGHQNAIPETSTDRKYAP